jgi:hypothetical protein
MRSRIGSRPPPPPPPSPTATETVTVRVRPRGDRGEGRTQPHRAPSLALAPALYLGLYRALYRSLHRGRVYAPVSVSVRVRVSASVRVRRQSNLRVRYNQLRLRYNQSDEHHQPCEGLCEDQHHEHHRLREGEHRVTGCRRAPPTGCRSAGAGTCIDQPTNQPTPASLPFASLRFPSLPFASLHSFPSTPGARMAHRPFNGHL